MSQCLFCRIIKKEIPAKIEFEDDEMIAIQDINPQAPVHLLIIPKKHIEGIGSLEKSDTLLIGHVIFSARQIAQKKGWGDYRLVLNQGAQAGQSVFHIHLHLLSGRRLTWPPG